VPIHAYQSRRRLLRAGPPSSNESIGHGRTSRTSAPRCPRKPLLLREVKRIALDFAVGAQAHALTCRASTAEVRGECARALCNEPAAVLRPASSNASATPWTRLSRTVSLLGPSSASRGSRWSQVPHRTQSFVLQPSPYASLAHHSSHPRSAEKAGLGLIPSCLSESRSQGLTRTTASYALGEKAEKAGGWMSETRDKGSKERERKRQDDRSASISLVWTAADAEAGQPPPFPDHTTI
jgi:hypothetical protein